MQIDRETLEHLARQADCGHESMCLDWILPEGLERFAHAIAQRAAEAERAAMKPHIIKALQDATQNMENYSYFGVNPGVHENDYEDVADAAIAARGAQGAQA